MDLLILDPADVVRTIESRRGSGLDRYDEVWDGVYIMSPLANNEHQQIIGAFDRCFGAVIADTGLGIVQPGANVSELAAGWAQNYRCPDVVVYLNSTPATDHNTHWQGGPDFAVEVVSHYDRSREKFDFYAKVGTRELLIVDRYPWALELYRLNDAGEYDLVGRSTVEEPDRLASVVLPLTFHLEAGASRPRIALLHTDDGRSWSA